jgi:hypothetical protein
MQDHPDKTALLVGVARFLNEELAPKIDDKGLRFRARIAAYLVRTVILEQAMGEGHDHAELTRLAALLEVEGELPVREADRVATLRSQNRQLAALIREGQDDDAIRAHVKATLQDKLQVVQPGFDTRLDVGD